MTPSAALASIPEEAPRPLTRSFDVTSFGQVNETLTGSYADVMNARTRFLINFDFTYGATATDPREIEPGLWRCMLSRFENCGG